MLVRRGRATEEHIQDWLAWFPLSVGSQPGREAFKEEFRILGYLEGKNIVIEWRSAEGKLDRLPGIADELLRLKVDVIVAPSTPSALAAKNATKTIPIVFYDVSDPVGAGLPAVPHDQDLAVLVSNPGGAKPQGADQQQKENDPDHR